jgi:hypothetical protein
VRLLSYKKRLLASSCPPHVPAWLPLDGFPWNLIMGTSMKICWKSPNLVKIRQKYEDLRTFYCCWLQKFTIKAFLCNTQFFLCCWQLNVAEQHTQNALLHFHCNNGYVNTPPCCIICTLPILFIPYSGLYSTVNIDPHALHLLCL